MYILFCKLLIQMYSKKRSIFATLKYVNFDRFKWILQVPVVVILVRTPHPFAYLITAVLSLSAHGYLIHPWGRVYVPQSHWQEFWGEADELPLGQV